MLVHLGENHRVLQAGIHHLVNQCTLVAQAVLMIADADNYHLWMSLQAGDVFLGWSTKLQGEELDVCLDAGDERHCHGREDRVELGTCGFRLTVQRLVNIVIYDVALTWHKLLRHLATYIDIIRRSILVLTNGALAVDSVADNHRNVVAADIAYSHGFAAGRAQPVEARTSCGRNHKMSLFLADVIHQMTSHRNLCSRLLAEAYTDCIADTVSQQGTDAHCTLDSAILSFASFGYAEVEWVVHAFLLHFFYQEAHGADHHYGVG